jgi:5-methylcytosine-specific restriction endonuclease McrA
MTPAIRRLLCDVMILDSEIEAAPALDDMARRARAIIEAERARKARVRAKATPRRQARELRSLADSARAFDLRAAAMKRDGRCQLCDDPSVREGLDLHHLDLGAGKARRERISNVMMAHRTCHDAYHANERAFVGRVKTWCRAYGYPLPNRRAFR